MYVIDGKRYYTKKEVAVLVGVSPQMIQLYHKWSEERVEKGEERFIPEPLRRPNGYKVWSEDDVEAIKAFRAGMERGDLADFSKQQWYYSTKKDAEEAGV